MSQHTSGPAVAPFLAVWPPGVLGQPGTVHTVPSWPLHGWPWLVCPLVLLFLGCFWRSDRDKPPAGWSRRSLLHSASAQVESAPSPTCSVAVSQWKRPSTDLRSAAFRMAGSGQGPLCLCLGLGSGTHGTILKQPMHPIHHHAMAVSASRSSAMATDSMAMTTA